MRDCCLLLKDSAGREDEMILITGGGGFLGLNLAKVLVDRKEKVLLFARRPIQLPFSMEGFSDNQVMSVSGDLLDLSHLCSVVKEYGVESIIHCAHQHEGRGSLSQTFKVNLEGTTHVLEAGRIFGLRRVSFISSATVYHGANVSAYHEDSDMPTESDGMIEAAKKAGEQICLLYMKRHGLSVSILRPPRIYGPYYYSGRIPVQTMVENAVANKPADLSHVHGESKSNYVYVKDCARGISLVHLAKTLPHSIYNVGDGVSISYSDIAQVIKEVIPEAVIRLGAIRTEKDVDRPPLDVRRIKEDAGFVAEYDLRQGIRDYIDWVRNGRK